MLLKKLIIPLATISSIVPITFAVQCSPKAQNPDKDQDDPSREVQPTEDNQIDKLKPQNPKDTNSNPNNGGATTSGANTSGSDDSKPKEQPATKLLSKAELINKLSSIANQYTSMKIILTVLKDNLASMKNAVKEKYPREDDEPYELVEFMQLVESITTLDIANLDDDQPKYRIPGSHGSTFTKAELVQKLNNIFIDNVK
ncbi:hypothetical protein [Mycoplasma seminis]|uniref:Variable surface lipoprotein n=1 Tax=Mycoplasma seminis TaxID=512749 RepID=A0ABY9HAS8_9MOLU|nr:hypothetical protein [Mycoplasma seminis]WLP85690.1 hypothetical protein Q8852_00835 [Mycoplasma seminis]